MRTADLYTKALKELGINDGLHALEENWNRSGFSWATSRFRPPGDTSVASSVSGPRPVGRLTSQRASHSFTLASPMIVLAVSGDQ